MTGQNIPSAMVAFLEDLRNSCPPKLRGAFEAIDNVAPGLERLLLMLHSQRNEQASPEIWGQSLLAVANNPKVITEARRRLAADTLKAIDEVDNSMAGIGSIVLFLIQNSHEGGGLIQDLEDQIYSSMEVGVDVLATRIADQAKAMAKEVLHIANVEHEGISSRLSTSLSADEFSVVRDASNFLDAMGRCVLLPGGEVFGLDAAVELLAHESVSPFAALKWLPFFSAVDRVGRAFWEEMWEGTLERLESAGAIGDAVLLDPDMLFPLSSPLFESVDSSVLLDAERYGTALTVLVAALSEGLICATAECVVRRRRFDLQPWMWRAELIQIPFPPPFGLAYLPEGRQGFPPPPSANERMPLADKAIVSLEKIGYPGDRAPYVLLIDREMVAQFVGNPILRAIALGVQPSSLLRQTRGPGAPEKTEWWDILTPILEQRLRRRESCRGVDFAMDLLREAQKFVAALPESDRPTGEAPSASTIAKCLPTAAIQNPLPVRLRWTNLRHRISAELGGEQTE